MDPISAIVGLVDASAMVEFSSTASADKLKAELMQLLNKTNEVVAGVTVVAADLDAAEVAIAGTSDHEARIADLEGNAAAHGTINVSDSSVSLTTAQCLANRVIICSHTGASQSIFLPAVGAKAGLVGCLPITFIRNTTYSAVQIIPVDSPGSGFFLGGTPASISLLNGGTVTVVPCASGDNVVWAIVSVYRNF